MRRQVGWHEKPCVSSEKVTSQNGCSYKSRTSACRVECGLALTDNWRRPLEAANARANRKPKRRLHKVCRQSSKGVERVSRATQIRRHDWSNVALSKRTQEKHECRDRERRQCLDTAADKIRRIAFKELERSETSNLQRRERDVKGKGGRRFPHCAIAGNR